MKKNIIRIMVCTLVAAFTFTGLALASDTTKKTDVPAVQEKSAEPVDDKKTTAPAGNEESAPPADQVTMTGTVEKTDDGIVIRTADAVFAVAGMDLAQMVGKNVNATGNVDKQVITVTEVKEAEGK